MEDYFYHVLNRGVEKRKIFLNNEYYIRFIDNISDFNNKNRVFESYNNRRKKLFSAMRKPKTKTEEEDFLVNLICWCLMPNHFHFLVKEKIDKGASIFSKKITSGYTQYFNLKNDRSGVLFQGRSKIIPLEKNEHFLWLPFYIMSNPIKLIEPEWKEEGIKDIKKAVEFLDNYKYSSFRDLIGKFNFPNAQNKNFFYEIYETNEKKFKKDFIEWLDAFSAMRKPKKL